MADPIRELLSQTSYDTDGTTTVWNFSFAGGYIDRDHVRVQTMDKATRILTDYPISGANFIGDFQLELTPAIPAGLELIIYRDTPKDIPLVNFADRAALTEVALDLNAKQSIFAAAEGYDTLNTSLAAVSQVGNLVEVAEGFAQAAGGSATAAAASEGAAAASAMSASSDAADAAASAAQAEATASGFSTQASRAVLSFPDLALAQAAASTLPDDQVVESPDANGRPSEFKVQSGVLEFDRFKPERDTLSLMGCAGDGATNDTAAISAIPDDGRQYNGLNLVYLCDAIPDLKRFKRAAFKVAGIIYPTDDYLGITVSKISNSRMYTAWPQDKCYVLGNQIKVGVNVQDGHVDADERAAFLISEDGGTYYDVPEYIDEKLHMSHWSAGTDGTYEYTILMDKSAGGSTFSYVLMRRLAPTGALANYDEPWVNLGVMSLVPPSSDTGSTPAIMHSFDVLPDGRIAVGTQFPNNVGFYVSSDQGASWSFISTKPAGTPRYVEPTIKHSGSTICGFLRPQSGTTKPMFWYSLDNMVTFNYVELQLDVPQSPVPLQIVDGVIHAFTSNRSGTQVGNPDDRPTPLYYVRASLAAVIANGASAFENIFLGTALHMEAGGASGVGVGSVVHYADKLFLFFGIEERTGGNFPASNNRRVNVWQAVIPLKKNAGYVDFRDRINQNSGSGWPGARRGGLVPGWIMDPGVSVVRKGHVLSTAYSSVPTTAMSVIDGRTGITSQYISTDGSIAEYSAVGAAGASSTCGMRYTLTNGNVQIFSANRAVVRWENTAGSESFVPEIDNAFQCGRTSRRWSQVSAVTGTINTSDAREKTPLQPISDALLDAIGEVSLGMFQWLDAIVAKGGDLARWHTGIIAQHLRDALVRHGVMEAGSTHSPLACLCYNEWPAEYEPIMGYRLNAETGEQEEYDTGEKRLILAAGNRWGIRADQCLFLRMAWVDRRADRIEARLMALEAK